MNVFSLEKGIKLNYYASYYPQGNGLAESTNKNLIKIIKRTVSETHKNWHNALYNSLWDDRVTPKAFIGNSPFFLIYRREAILPPTCLTSFSAIITESSRRRFPSSRKPNKCFIKTRRGENTSKTKTGSAPTNCEELV
jgi:hypothetical protein